MERVNEMIEIQETKVKKKNKGFSLVELIVVIAIMAILVGIVGTQVLPYIERSRVARDEQILSALATSTLTTFSQNAGALNPASTYTITAATGSDFLVTSSNAADVIPAAVRNDFIELSAWDTWAAISGALDSRAASDLTNITITYAANTGLVTVAPNDTAAPSLTAVTAQ